MWEHAGEFFFGGMYIAVALFLPYLERRKAASEADRAAEKANAARDERIEAARVVAVAKMELANAAATAKEELVTTAKAAAAAQSQS
jgi:hypothetical protein